MKRASDGTDRAIRTVVGSVVLVGLAAFVQAEGRAVREAAVDVPSSQSVMIGRGDVAVAAPAQNRVFRIDTMEESTVLAGTGEAGFAGDGGPADQAELYGPLAVAVDPEGNVFIADTGNNRIRRVEGSSGTIETIAGDGEPGFEGDGGDASLARLNAPAGLALDASGNLFIADTGNHRIRRVDAVSGVIETVAGDGTPGFGGDGGPATSAHLRAPSGLVVDAAYERIVVADTGNHRVRVLEADGTIDTLAGSGVAGFAGDDGPAVEAQLRNPTGVSLARRDVLIADTGNHRVRRVSPDGTIRTAGETFEAPIGDILTPSLLQSRGTIEFLSATTQEIWSLDSRQLVTFAHTFRPNTLFYVEISRDGGFTWQVVSRVRARRRTVSLKWRVQGPTGWAYLRIRSAGARPAVAVSAPIGIWQLD
jgi:DNA-binding beta-propeller fold protein YncE